MHALHAAWLDSFPTPGRVGGMTLRPRRSVLYMPGSNARALEKAKTLPADGVILDLEDSVAPDAKEMAREQAIQAVKDGGFGRRELVIRVNGADTPWGEADIRAAAAARTRSSRPFTFASRSRRVSVLTKRRFTRAAQNSPSLGRPAIAFDTHHVWQYDARTPGDPSSA